MNYKCPTCGHIHPHGIGVTFCGCADCSLIWTDTPELMTEEYQKKRRELLAKVEADQ